MIQRFEFRRVTSRRILYLFLYAKNYRDLGCGRLSRLLNRGIPFHDIPFVYVRIVYVRKMIQNASEAKIQHGEDPKEADLLQIH